LSSGAKLLVLLPDPLPSQATVHRIPVRHGLLAGTPRRKPRQCQRGERDTAMRLWQTAGRWPSGVAGNDKLTP
jgi:hypothetical protein